MRPIPLTTALLLAGGRGSRMQRADPTARLTSVQADRAARGLKTMVPDAAGRPFLSHILAGLADVGIERVVLVVPPDHAIIRHYYQDHQPSRLRLDYVVQAEPRGTADAVVSAAAALADEPFLILNGDNLYPAAALEALIGLDEPGVAGFTRAGLLEGETIPASRLAAFALLEVGPDGYLRSLVEKPHPARLAAQPEVLISMNLWRGDAKLLAACRRVPLSSRGEYELPEAVAHALDKGLRLRVVPIDAPVLDLSHRADVAPVAARLGRRRLAL